MHVELHFDLIDLIMCVLQMSIFGDIGKANSKGYNFLFHENFSISMFTNLSQNGLSMEV